MTGHRSRSNGADEGLTPEDGGDSPAAPEQELAAPEQASAGSSNGTPEELETDADRVASLLDDRSPEPAVDAGPTSGTVADAEPEPVTELPSGADPEPGAEVTSGEDSGPPPEAQPEPVADDEPAAADAPAAAVEPAAADEPAALPELETKSPPKQLDPKDRDPDLIMAAVHLRLGALGLARAELEALAGKDRLDDPAIRDLAEARWRTGDVAGAGEAAATYLEVAPGDVVALVIASEAQSDLGRPAEARRLAGRAVEAAGGSLDPVFAGMKRSSVWPVEAGSRHGPDGVLFDDLHPRPALPSAGHRRRSGDASISAAGGDRRGPIDPAVPSAIDQEATLWGPTDSARPLGSAVVDPARLLDVARTAIAEERVADAAAGLLLALRAAPRLAPAVLDLVAGRPEPILAVVRGDALRIVGHEQDALRDDESAARRLVEIRLPAQVDAAARADRSAADGIGAVADVHFEPPSDGGLPDVPVDMEDS
jgi:hypothetical protein